MRPNPPIAPTHHSLPGSECWEPGPTFFAGFGERFCGSCGCVESPNPLTFPVPFPFLTPSPELGIQGLSSHPSPPLFSHSPYCPRLQGPLWCATCKHLFAPLPESWGAEASELRRSLGMASFYPKFHPISRGRMQPASMVGVQKHGPLTLIPGDLSGSSSSRV